MKTNYILQILLSLLLSVGFISCSDDKDNNPAPDRINFVIENDVLSFQKESNSISFRIKSEVYPQISCPENWVELNLERLTASIYRLDVKVADNTGDDRTASVTITSGTESKTLTINQSSQPQASAYEVASWLGLGWNAGNQMDSYKNGVASETSDGNPILTQELFDKIKAAGIKTVRIPVTWIGHIGPAPDYIIDDRLERVAEIVGYAEKAGLNIIINLHHDGSGGYGFWLDFKPAAANVAKNLEVEDQIRKVWTQIAKRFVDTGDFLIFEAFNEIHDGDWGWGANLTDNGHQYNLLNEWLQVFVDAVRSTGGKNATRYLGVAGYSGGWELIEHLELPKDPTIGRLLVSVHCYSPGKFCMEFYDEGGNYTYFPEWGHTATEGKYPADDVDEEGLEAIFRGLKERFIDKNIPVYIGEFTCTNRPDGRESAFRDYYLEYFCKAAHDCGLSPVFWDNGGKGIGAGQGAIFDRQTGDYIHNNEASVAAMVRAVYDDSPEYTLKSIYDRAPAAEEDDKQ